MTDAFARYLLRNMFTDLIKNQGLPGEALDLSRQLVGELTQLYPGILLFWEEEFRRAVEGLEASLLEREQQLVRDRGDLLRKISNLHQNLCEFQVDAHQTAKTWTAAAKDAEILETALVVMQKEVIGVE